MEIFESEFEKNWAMLGLNWTVNFSGLLIFMVANVAVGDFSVPWPSMIAPAIQTIVLAYALRKVPGKSGGIRAVLFMLNIVVLIGMFFYFHDKTSGVERLCTDVSLFRFDGYDDMNASDSFSVYVPDDCFDVGQMLGDSVVVARESSDVITQVFVAARSCVDGECSTTTTFTTATTELNLGNEHPLSFQTNGVIDGVVVALAGVSVVVVGASFVNLIVASHWPLEEPSNPQKVLKALVVCGWVGVYPVFELLRVLGKLRRWLECLSRNLKEDKYKFELCGEIVLSPQAELDAPAS